ncbi:MAG: efflux RND transporter periplasmic adaptor subunit [Deltaproteobacteria bacterium]|jgi:membrane fusion protein (multidrug efflux system)|nr:efflux RND transporter periplasmic adaptor subunit [Deltaproteobacteria bacterium]
MSNKTFAKNWIFFLIPLIIVVLTAAVILYGFLWTTPPIKPSPQRVVLDEISLAAPIRSLRAIGLIEANQSVELRARVSGFLLKKNFTEGDRVKKDQVLFQIEPDTYKASLDSAEAEVSSAQAQLDKAEVDFTRVSDLFQKRASPKSDFDTAQAALNVARGNHLSAQARLAQAKLNFEYTSIKAPFDGKISDTPFDEGSLITPDSGPLAIVVADDPIEVSFGLPDRVMNEARLGLERNGLPGGSIENLKPRIIIKDSFFYEKDGQIIYISPQIDKQTDTVKLKARFDNPKGALAAGQSVVVSLEPKKPKQVTLLPKPCVMTSAGQTFVYLTAPSPTDKDLLVTEARNVTLGVEYDEGFEVIEGLKPGDKVIELGLMSGGARLRGGMPVTVVDNPDKAQNGPSEPNPADSGAKPNQGTETGGR